MVKNPFLVGDYEHVIARFSYAFSDNPTHARFDAKTGCVEWLALPCTVIQRNDSQITATRTRSSAARVGRGDLLTGVNTG